MVFEFNSDIYFLAREGAGKKVTSFSAGNCELGVKRLNELLELEHQVERITRAER